MSIKKGIKYYSESYIHILKVHRTEIGCMVTGKCHRSQRKSEDPYNVKVQVYVENSGPVVKSVRCECAVGLSASCGHITGLLYQLANFKTLGIKALPEDITKTSLPQTFHLPRGEKIGVKSVQEVEIRAYAMTQDPGSSNEEPKTIKSTIYNAIRGEPTNWKEQNDTLAAADQNIFVLASQFQPASAVQCKFGQVPHGSVLSYQQKLNDDFIINILDGVGFPSFSTRDVMNYDNNASRILSPSQDINLKGLHLSYGDISKFEEKTSLQSQNRQWYTMWEKHVTASQIDRIYKRSRDDEGLEKLVKSTRRVVTAAMRSGIACEPVAAKKYAEALENSINQYPCGVVVSFGAPWYAASPDRKVYDPTRNPPFGFLKIKCPRFQVFWRQPV